MKEANKAATNAKQAAQGLLAINEAQRSQALSNIANLLRQQSDEIIAENQKDIQQANQLGLSDALVDRLSLDQSRIEALADSVESIAGQDQVVNEIISELKRDDGLLIQKQRVPIGVLAMIFESRPNVVIDCSALAIKSGNAIILKGGKEAHHSNLILAEIVVQATKGILPDNTVQLVTSRDDVAELLQQVGLIDLIIPRGGESLIKYVVANSRVPVLAHYKGLCHIYIDASANLDSAKEIVINAKVQRPGVCNAVETLLLNENLKDEFILDLFDELEAQGVELRVCGQCPRTEKSILATEQDWDTEYLDKILSVKKVSSVQQACDHIKQFGSQHTEAILSSDQANIDYFQLNVDASSVMINASTRFNDGGEYLLGAELGISTTKIHAYGPMGAKEMTISRHLVIGQGHIRK
ncbi:MAG: glutamate-5-semialdehyde dehydrogenase [Gammaproteobacteria bacterium]|nr:MAG: glutamate-5-semialdehyde dehydrogenase [Gammaproteobacteria bacterium]